VRGYGCGCGAFVKMQDDEPVLYPDMQHAPPSSHQMEASTLGGAADNEDGGRRRKKAPGMLPAHITAGAPMVRRERWGN
jgi:hypothetical protein